MNKFLNNHNQILEDIKEIFAEVCKTDLDDINLSVEDMINYEIIPFQYHCTYMYSTVGKPIYLNFRVYNSKTQILEFESNTGPRYFDKRKDYKGLKKSIRKSIKSQINKSS
ncbi:MAG: hypothetical protein GWP19_03115 [Planctomycetia bacterium]|nr:hypothetical protein [Planctomycetia bacterium]